MIFPTSHIISHLIRPTHQNHMYPYHLYFSLRENLISSPIFNPKKIIKEVCDNCMHKYTPSLMSIYSKTKKNTQNFC